MTKLITETKATFGTLAALLKQCERSRPDLAGPISNIRGDIDVWATVFGELVEQKPATDSIDDVT